MLRRDFIAGQTALLTTASTACTNDDIGPPREEPAPKPKKVAPKGKAGKGALERMFTPEFRNRLDAVVFFEGLPIEVIKQVAQKFVDELDGQLAAKKVQLDVTPAALAYFADKGYDKAMGARPMARVISDAIKKPLANEILFGALVHGGVAKIDVVDDKVVITYESAPPPADDAN